MDTLQSVITHRYAVVMSYARSVKQTYSVEAARQRARILNGGLSRNMPSFQRLRRWFLTEESALAEIDRTQLASTLAQIAPLNTLCTMGRELAALWEQSTDSSDELLGRLQAGVSARTPAIGGLQRVSRRLRSYA